MERLRRFFVPSPQDHVWLILRDNGLSARDKAKQLGALRLEAQLDKNTQAAREYGRAESAQWIYHYLHESKGSEEERRAALAKYGWQAVAEVVSWEAGLSLQQKLELLRTRAARMPGLNKAMEALIRQEKGMNSRDKINLLATFSKTVPGVSPDLPGFIAECIVMDGTMDVKDKIVVLQSWAKRYARSKEIRRAVRSQMEYAENHPQRVPDDFVQAHEDQARELTQAKGVSVESLMKDPWVVQYAQLEKMDGKKLRQVLEKYFDDLTAMANLYWTYRGERMEFRGLKMWGPDMRVPFNELASQLALAYLEMETRFNANGRLERETCLDLAHFFQAFNGKECNFLVGNQGYTAGLSNGTGPFQLTAICVYAVVHEKLGEINQRVQSWGGTPFDANLGRYYEAKDGRWVSTVQVQAAVEAQPAQGKREAKYTTCRYEPENRRIPPAPGENIVRGPKFKDEFTQPARSIRLASAALIMYQANPYIGLKEMQKIGERFNGNNRRVEVNQGGQRVKEKIKTIYGREIPARVQKSKAASEEYGAYSQK